MFRTYREKVSKFRSFLGNQVWRLFFASIFTGVLLFLIESSFVLVFQGFLCAIGLVRVNELSLPSWYPSDLNYSVLLFLAFGVLRAIIMMIRHYVSTSTGLAFVRLQRNRVIEYGLTNTGRVPSHVLFSTASERVAQAGNVLQHLSQIILMGTSCLLFFLLGLKTAPWEMGIGLVFLAVFMLPFKKFNVLINSCGDAINRGWEAVHRVVIQSHRHNFFLRIYGLLGEEIAKARAKTYLIENNQKKAYKLISVKSYYPSLVGMCVICIITYASVRFLHTSGIALISFLYLFMRLAQGAGDVNGSLSELRLGLGAFKEVHRFHILLAEQQKEALGRKHSEPLPNHFFRNGVTVTFENVSFSYDGAHEVLQGVNLQVKRGEVLLVKGPSGGGKSTMLALGLGILKPQSGFVLVNGVEISNVQDELYQRLGYVGPEPYMIDGTLRENLLFGHPHPKEVSEQEIFGVLKLVRLEGERFLPDFFINEQTPLSTGQKQRVSIARALLRKPQLLVLDEATANLDTATEFSILEALRPFFVNVTVIVTSHKSSFDSMGSQVLILGKTASTVGV